VASQIAGAHRCRAEVSYIHQVHAVINDEQCARRLRQSAERVVGSENWVEAEPTMGGEDFAFYQLAVPGCFFWLGTGPQENAENAHGLHSPLFVADESCLLTGATVFATLIADRLGIKEESGD